MIHPASLFPSTPPKPSSFSASPARKQLGDFCPAVSQLLVGLVDDSVLLLGPRGLLDLWIQVVVPALAALLADASLQVLGDHRPALGSVLLDQLDHLWCLREKQKVQSQQEEEEQREKEVSSRGWGRGKGKGKDGVTAGNRGRSKGKDMIGRGREKTQKNRNYFNSLKFAHNSWFLFNQWTGSTCW